MHKIFRLFYVAVLATACLSFRIAKAQGLPGVKDSLNSAILKQERIFQVIVPPDYKPESADKYDVLYILDGEGNTQLAHDVSQFIAGENFMPHTIIVGVFNIDRDHDLTPTHVKDNGTSGGAGPFLSFLKSELIPYINKKYPADGVNTLFGHSFGGLFVTYAMLNDPGVFQSYIAADPSFWWDKHYMNKVAIDKLPALANLNLTFFMSGREGMALTGMGIPPMDSILKKYAPPSLTWKLSAYPDETHGSVRLKSMYDGLRFTYAGYNDKAPVFHPMAGIVLKDKPIKLWLFDNPDRVRYSTDGVAPTKSSPKMLPEQTISGGATVIATSFSVREAYNRSDTGVFVTGDYLPAMKSPKKLLQGGMHYQYYEGDWNKLPDFEKLKPVREGFADSTFQLGKLPRKENFGLVLQGMIAIDEEGYYIFGLNSDDGSKFYLDNKLVINNDGIHGSDGVRSYIVPLRKGFYPVRIEYFQKGGGSALNLEYLTPFTIARKDPKGIPFKLQYGR